MNPYDDGTLCRLYREALAGDARARTSFFLLPQSQQRRAIKLHKSFTVKAEKSLRPKIRKSAKAIVKDDKQAQKLFLRASAERIVATTDNPVEREQMRKWLDNHG